MHKLIGKKECQETFDYLKTMYMHHFIAVSNLYTLYCGNTSDTCLAVCLTQPCESTVETNYGDINIKQYIFCLTDRANPKIVNYWKTHICNPLGFTKIKWLLAWCWIFVTKTDQTPLKYILDSPMQNGKVQLFALRISVCKCDIEYLSWIQNNMCRCIIQVAF